MQQSLCDALQLRLLEELRNPLSIIISGIQQLSTQYPGSGPIIQEVFERSKDIEELNNIMAALLELRELPSYKKGASERGFVESREEYPGLHFRNLAESFVLQAGALKIDLEYEVAEHFPVLPARPIYLDVLRYVLRDSLNRIKKAPNDIRKPCIKLRCYYSEQRKEVIFEIEDNGMAVAASERLNRPDSSYQHITTDLIIVKLLVGYTAGRLHTYAQNGVNYMRLSLPVASFAHTNGRAIHNNALRRRAADTAYVSRPVAPLTAARAAKILIADDDAQMRAYLSVLLRRAGYNIVEAKNGMDALSILSTQADKPSSDGQPVELLISDLMMPVMNGYELAKELKKMPGLRDLPCIFLTARADQQHKLKALRMGVNDYLTKPFQASELEARCRNLLDWSAARTRAQQQSEFSDYDRETGTAPDTGMESISGRFRKLILDNITHSKMTLPEIAFELNLSERNLYRKVKEETGLTPNAFVREVRLLKARELLEEGRAENLKQLGYDVGITQSSYLKKLYIKRFGKDPMELL